MFEGLHAHQLEGAIEAMLFVTDEPVSTITLSDMLEVDAADVEMALVDIRARLQEQGSGIQLMEVAGGWRFATHPDFHELLERYVLSWDTRKLSQAMLEVLAIVAYTQPVTRQGIAAVRGVNSDSSINSLIDKGLIREAGTQDTPGYPVLYATTRTFLEKFGLRALDDLPELAQYAPDDETRNFIASRLSSTRTSELDLHLEPEDTTHIGFDAEELADQMTQAMQGMLDAALSRATGVVEKVDFDELQFEE